ncbi:MAG TPA: hypothetical protein VIV06_03575, partial [Candidatus Limnocylindrales bacterium]
MSRDASPDSPVTAPHGAWRSPFPISLLVDGYVGLRETRIEGDDVYWIETRPDEGGRQVVVRRRSNGTTEDVSAPGINARNRVHEYGGGSYVVVGGTVCHASWTDGRWYRRDPDGASRPITPDGPFRYADAIHDREHGRLIAVREDHSRPGEAVNSIVSI